MARPTSTPGAARERIRVDQETSTRDAGGGRSRAWVTYLMLWADVQPPAGITTEQMEGGGLSPVAFYRFKIRRRLDLDPATMRIAWPVDPMTGGDIAGTRLYNLRAVNPGSTRDLYMTIDAEAGVGT